MRASITLPIEEYDEMKKAGAKEYSRGYEAGLDTARKDFAEVNAHKNELLRCVELLEGQLAEERAKNSADPARQSKAQGHSAADIVKRIAEVSIATGAMAGEPAIELAGQIISVLVVHPEHIDRFMAEGSELFIDGTFNPEHGSMTYRANSGAILHPSVLREKNGSQQ